LKKLEEEKTKGKEIKRNGKLRWISRANCKAKS
jgi:hypothetical protein